MKLRTQLLIFILGVVLIGFATILVVSYHSSRKTVVGEIYEKAENIRQKHQEYLNGFFRASGKVASGMAHSVRLHEKMSEKEVHDLLKQNLTWNPEIYGMTIFFEPEPDEVGKKLFAPYYFRHGQLMKYIPAKPTFEFQDQDWYREPKEQSKPVWTEPYYDKGADAIMTTYSVPIYQEGKFIGLATVDIGLDALAKRVEAIQIGQSGYAMLVSRNGTFLAHPVREFVLNRKIQDLAEEEDDKDFKELSGKMVKGRDGAMSVLDPHSGKRSWVTYGTIPFTGYSLAVLIPENELLLSVGQLGRTILWISAVVTVLLVLAIFMISTHITNPIRKLSKSAQMIASGHLDTEISGSDSRSEVGRLTDNIQKMVGTIRQMLAAVSEEKEKFEKVFTTMSDGIVVTDAGWKVISVNQAAVHMLDINAGMHLIDHLSKNYQSNFNLTELLDYKRKDKHIEIIRPESEQVGEMFFCGSINTIVDADDRITSNVLTVRDVTEERKEELNKSNLLSLISHKLRTPITVLQGTASLFTDGILGDLTEKQMENMRKMTVQASKLQDLVGRLIGYVTLTGASKVEREEIDMASFLTDLTEKHSWESEGRVADVEVDVAPDVGKWMFNPGHLRLIVSELVENATRFNHQEKSEIKITCRRESGGLILEVTDNGMGIASIHHDHIFERFFQVDKDFTGNKEGIGLGLSLVKAFVDSMGGTILVSSKEGEGTTFTLEFPGDVAGVSS